MKYTTWFKKCSSMVIIASLLLTYVPQDVLATSPQDVNVNLNVDAKGGRTSVTTNDTDVDILVDVDLVQRTMNILDVAKFVNTSNTHKIKQDYKPSLKDTLVDNLQEYKYADIVEYEGFSKDLREPVAVEPSADSAYAAKVEWLIDHNMVNRTTYYMFSDSMTYSSMDRTPRPATEVGQKEKGDDYQKQDTKNFFKLYNPDHKISKTDFLTELMKADKIKESRPIIVQTPYTRLDTNLNLAKILTEPIEESPYTSELGRLGLDFASNEIVADHTVFKQAEVLVTNDVVEMYLNAALNKNIISIDELGGIEGEQLKSERSNITANVRDGYLRESTPIRQEYDGTSFKLHKKIKEEDIVYPATLEDGTYSEVKKEIVNVTDDPEAGTLPPWGRSYHYNTEEFCIFANPANKEPIEIVKRPSVVEVNNNQYNYTPEVKSIEEEKGYEYFTKEEITVAEAYILTYKLLQAMGDESKLTQSEIDYLNSCYSLNFSNFTEEERTAAEYLIAKGILDGGDKNLYLASSASLTNKDAVDLIYRVANKEARIAFTPTMNNIDREMATKGYAQAVITKTEDMGDSFEVLDDVTKGKKLYTKDENGNLIEVPRETKTYSQIQNADRVKNPSTYDLIYIKLPKIPTEELIANGGYCHMITNDEFRTVIEPANQLINYGKQGVSDNRDKLFEGEDVYGGNNGLSYVLKDEDGNYWVRYIVHKSLSSKISLQIYTSKGTSTYTGIRGEGVYYVNEASSVTSFRKTALLDAKELTPLKHIFEVVIEQDLKLRNNTFTPEKKTETASVDTSKIMGKGNIGDDALIQLWTQEAYGKPDDTAKVNSIALGVQPNGEGLEYITYNGGKLFVKDASTGNWVIDKQNMKATSAVKDSFTGLYQDSDGKYYLQYTSPYQNSADSALVDVVTKMHRIGSAEYDKDKMSSVGGYAKIDSNGKTVALIAQEELARYDIEVKGSTGRMLYNKKTGQRAFINSTDNTTWIGNNVTKYAPDQLMVTATGEGTEKKIYYNLAIVLELINNTKVVLQNAGKEIFVAVGDAGVTSMEGYRMIDIADVYKGTSTNHTKVDTTYVASVDKFKNVYMDMSAVSGNGSNFIYFKDAEKNLKALIVYKPMVITEKIKDYDPARGVYDSSSSLLNTVPDGVLSSKVDSPTNDSFYSDAVTNMLIKSLMGVTESKAASDTLQGHYMFNIYLLERESSKDAFQKSFNSLVETITGGNASNLDILKRATSYVGPEIGISDFAQSKKLTSQTNVAFYTMIVGTGFNSNRDFVAHAASGNFYALINKNGAPYYNQATKVFDTRFYLRTSTNTDGSKYLYKTLDYETLNKKTDRDQTSDIIMMRYKQYYANTPYNYIPLEVYGMVSQRSGIGLANSSGWIKKGDNVITNFREEVPVKLVTSPHESKTQDSNVYISIVDDKTGGVDVTLATLLELPYKTLPKNTLISLLNAPTVNNKDKYLNALYDHICTDFDAVTGTYKIKDAIGNAVNGLGSSTGWSYLSSVKSQNKKVSSEQKEQFFQGMWYGLVSDEKTQSYYSLNPPTDMGKYKNYVMVAGNATNENGYNHEATLYIGDITTDGHATNLRPIKGYTDLPAPLRYYIDCAANNYDKDATKAEDRITIARDYGVSESEVETTFKEVKVYYKPTLAVPAGTTLVEIPTDQKAPKTLVLCPNTNIRSLYFPAKDVINSALMMAQEKDEATFLYQLKKGSKVILPGGDSVVKLTAANSTSNGAKLKWVKCASAPSISSDGNAIQYEKLNFVSEARLLAEFIIKYYNQDIKMAGSVKGASTKLGQIMGPGSYRLPTINELKFLLSSNESSYPSVYELYKNVHSVFGFNPNQYDTTTGSCSYNPMAYHYDATQDAMLLSGEGVSSTILLTLNLPPSLQVKQVEGLQDTWQVVSYWDIENFAVSAEDEIVAYIRERDTEIMSVTEILKSLKSQNMDGIKYSDFALDKNIKNKWNGLVGFITYGVPALVIILWLYLSVLYVIIFFGWTRDKCMYLNKRLGFDLIERISFGIYATTRELPDLKAYLITSLSIFTALAILWGKYLLTWIAHLL